MEMSILLQFLINGLFVSSVYALVSLGLTLIFGVMDIADFAQGALYMVGAFVAYYLMTVLGLGMIGSLALGMTMVAVIAAFNFLVTYRPLVKVPGPNTFVAALGILVVLENLVQFIAGPDPLYMDPPFGSAGLVVAGASVTYQRAFLIGMTALFIVGVWVFLGHTKAGKALRALSQNKTGAAVCGINNTRVSVIAFLLAGSLAGAAGVLMAPVVPVEPFMGTAVIVKSFAITIVGGMGSVPGALLGALVVGMSESLATAYLPSVVTNLIAFVLMILVLLFRPEGLFGEAEH